MDFYKKHQEKIVLQENIFSKVSGMFTGNTKNNQKVEIFQEKNGVIVINGRSTIKDLSSPPSIDYLNSYSWANSPLNFVIDSQTEFHADQIQFDLKKNELYSFNGIWNKGEFKGNIFRGIFRGSSFTGRFIGPYQNYQASPITFLGFTFFDPTSKGLLGLPNTTTIGSENFNFITIPGGYTLYMKSATGIESYIRILKRLDKDNDTWEIELLDGFKGATTPVQIKKQWSEFRAIWQGGILEINPKKSTNIAGLIQVPEGDEIVEMRVTKAPIRAGLTAPQVRKMISDFVPGKTYEFNLSKIPNLGIPVTKGKINLKFNSEKDLDNFNKVMQYANSDEFAYDLNNVRRAIKFSELSPKDLEKFSYINYLLKDQVQAGQQIVKEIAGEEPVKKMYYDVPGQKYPKKLFPIDPETNQPIDPKFAKEFQRDPRLKDVESAYSSANRINIFIKNLISSIPDDVAQYTVLNRLKSIFTNQFVTDLTKSATQPVKPSTRQDLVNKLKYIRSQDKK